MKKFLTSIIILASLVFSVLPVSAAGISATSTNETYKKAYNETYNVYKNDAQFQMMVEAYGVAYGEKFLTDVTNSKLTSTLLRSGGGNECYQYVTNVMQTTTNNCGSTSTLQTLYGLNSASTVSGSTNAAKIATLDAEYNVASQGSMMVYQVRDALNKYLIGNKSYIYALGSGMTIDQFETNIANSLTYGKPVVLHARTGYLTYYGGKNLKHYLSLDYVNRTSDTVRIVDCNYDSTYYGIHNNVTLLDAYNTIHAESGRYLIY